MMEHCITANEGGADHIGYMDQIFIFLLQSMLRYMRYGTVTKGMRQHSHLKTECTSSYDDIFHNEQLQDKVHVITFSFFMMNDIMVSM
jgi:hypothetical protein